jgi:hypothetical protein
MATDTDQVAGIVLSPVTPRTFSRLLAINSPFVRVKAEAGKADVRNYIWIHHPKFTVDPLKRDKAQAEVFAEIQRNIAPSWNRWKYSKQGCQTREAAGYAIAAGMISELMEVAFADNPPPSGSGSSPVASLEAQFVDTFASCYHQWPLETPIRDTPLRVLYQLLRCQNGTDFDADEAAVIAEDLAKLNAHKLNN